MNTNTKTIEEAQEITHGIQSGFSWLKVLAWSSASFLLGLSLDISAPAGASEELRIALRFTNGISLGVFGGLISAASVFVGRKNRTSPGKMLRRYNRRFMTVIVLTFLLAAFNLYTIFIGASILVVIDIAILCALIIGMYKKNATAKYLLAAYAFVNPVYFAASGIYSVGNIIWSVIFLNVLLVIIAEKRRHLFDSSA